MIIKSYTAESVNAALKTIRSDMGSDAVVLKTREMTSANGEALIEVTACLDSPTAEQADKALTNELSVNNRIDENDIDNDTIEDQHSKLEKISVTNSHSDNSLSELNQKIDHLLNITLGYDVSGIVEQDEFEKINARLISSEVPVEIRFQLLSHLKNGKGNLFTTAENELEKLLNNKIDTKLDFKPGDSVLFFGPAGAGKTSLLGRIAAQLVTNNKAVKLKTIDRSKVGAHEEIYSYSDLLSVDIAEENEKNKDSVLLIDSPSLSLNHDDRIEFLNEIHRIKPTYKIAVFSSVFGTNELNKFCGLIDEFKPTHIAMTMLDLSDSYGRILTVTEAMKAKLSFITDSPAGIEMAKVPNALMISKLVLNRGQINE